MKTLAVVFSALLLLSFFGCQESLVNQPESTFETSQNKTSPATDAVSGDIIKKEIKLCCTLCDPSGGECKIIGKVIYTHKMIAYSAGIATIHLKHEMDSELCSRMMHAMKCSIYGNCSDVVYVDESGVQILEKNYEIEHRPDVRLGVRYKVTRTAMEVEKITLHQIDQ